MFNYGLANVTMICFLLINFNNSVHLKEQDKVRTQFDIDLQILSHNKNSTMFLSSSLLQKTSYYTSLNLHKTISSSSYVGIITVGNTNTSLPILFDTGSGYTWLASKYCKHVTKKCQDTLNYYDSGDSASFKSLNMSIEATFGTGKLKGLVGSDVIFLTPAIKLNNELIEIVDVEDNILYNGGMSGIIGLAYSNSSLLKHTFFDGLIESKALIRNVIGFYFGENGGKINFGYIDPTKYKGKLNKHKVIDKFYWTLKLDEIKLNSSHAFCENNCKVIIDTGSSVVGIPSKFYKKLMKLLNLKDDCSNLPDMPEIEFILDTVAYKLKPKMYVRINYINHQAKCILNFSPMAIPRLKEDTIILGVPFIKSYYTILDRDNDEVSFGEII